MMSNQWSLGYPLSDKQVNIIVYMYIYIYTHTHMHVCMCVYIYYNSYPDMQLFF